MVARLSDMAGPVCKALLCSSCSLRPPSCLEITQDMHHFRSQLIYFSARVHLTSCNRVTDSQSQTGTAQLCVLKDKHRKFV